MPTINLGTPQFIFRPFPTALQALWTRHSLNKKALEVKLDFQGKMKSEVTGS